MGQNSPSKIAIIEPSAIIQSGLKTIIQHHCEFELVAQLPDMNHYEQRLIVVKPDLIIINPSIVEFHRRSQIHSMFRSFDPAAIVALVSGYMDGHITTQFDGLLDILHSEPKIISTLRSATKLTKHPASANVTHELTQREREILIAIVRGLTNKEIADFHHISIHTVISHRKNIIAKTNIKSLSGLTVYALLNNLIEQEEIR